MNNNTMFYLMCLGQCWSSIPGQARTTSNYTKIKHNALKYHWFRSWL